METINNYMKFIEDDAFGYYYFSFNGLEIRFDKDAKWGYKWKAAPGEFESLTSEVLEWYIRRGIIPIEEFEKTLYSTISSMVVYYDYRYRAAIDLLGEQGVQDQLDAWKDFATSLAQAVQELVKGNDNATDN